LKKLADNEVLVLFTMDVELASSGSTTSGPRNNKEGAQRIKEYMETVGDYGYTPTFFIHPELGEDLANLFLGLKECGACLGLHIHSTKFAPVRHEVELGALSFDEQKKILKTGMDVFENYFKFRPKIFRPGCFSANDHTYKVLNELGFIGGSVCIPGRIWAERYCIWAGAYPYAHYANENMRQMPGRSPFVEIPLSVDTSRLVRHPLGFDHYFDLRPGDVYSDENVVERDHRQVLSNIIKQLANDNPVLKTIVIDVHNDRNFKDISITPAKQLKAVLENLRPELGKYGLVPVNASYVEAIQQFRTRANQCMK